MVFKVAIPGKIQFKMYRKEPGFFLTRQGDTLYRRLGGASATVGNGERKCGDQ